MFTLWICSCLKWSQSSSFSIPMTDNLISKRWSKSFFATAVQVNCEHHYHHQHYISPIAVWFPNTPALPSVASTGSGEQKKPKALLFLIIMRQTWIVTLDINTAILHFHFHWNHAWTTCQLVKVLVKLVSLVTRFKSGLVISILSASRKSPFLQVLSWVELRIMDRI